MATADPFLVILITSIRIHKSTGLVKSLAPTFTIQCGFHRASSRLFLCKIVLDE